VSAERPQGDGDHDLGGWRCLALRLLLDSRTPRWLRRRLHARMVSDTALRARYEALRRLERELAAGPDLLASQRELLGELVLARVQGTGSRRASAYLGAALATTTALALALWLWPAPPSTDALMSRSGRDAALGVRVRCVRADGSAVLDSAFAGARQPVAALTCPRGSLLSFSATNLTGQAQHLFVVGLASDLSPRWYQPFTADSTSRLVAAGSVEQLLEPLADTAPMPDEGREALFVFYALQPLTAFDIEQAIAALARERWPLSTLQRLPVAAEVQARIELSTWGHAP
jgi:hypothetical protein